MTYWGWAPALFPQAQTISNEPPVVANQESEELQYIGVHGDYVAVFCGEPGLGGHLIEETEIPIATIPESILLNLYQGIVFTNDEIKVSILEGLYFTD